MRRASPKTKGLKLIRRPKVEDKTGLSRSAIYFKNLHDPDWPKPISIGLNTVAWVESEIDDWIRRRIADTRQQAA